MKDLTFTRMISFCLLLNGQNFGRKSFENKKPRQGANPSRGGRQTRDV